MLLAEPQWALRVLIAFPTPLMPRVSHVHDEPVAANNEISGGPPEL